MPSIQELESRKDELLQALSLDCIIEMHGLPALLEHANLQPFTQLLEHAHTLAGNDPELTEFITDFIERSEEGLITCLESDIACLEKVRETGQDVVEHTAFGMVEGFFPVRFDGQVVHCLHTQRLRDQPFSKDELAKIADVSGAELERVAEAAEAIPVLQPGQCTMTMDLYRVLRDSLEQVLAGQAQCSNTNHQLLQSERTRSLGTLSGGVAHHFNNLLSVILGYSSFVLNREDHSKEATEALRKIGEAAQKGRRLTEEILAFAGSDVEEETPCHVHETLSNVLSLIESEVPTHIRIERHLDAERDTVVSPPSAIHQIIFNLVTNGIDSMPGGGTLTATTSNIHLEKESGKEFLKIEVTDSSGVTPGIDATEEVMQQLPTSGIPGERSDMRLSSVYGMVGRMEGTVTVTTEPGALTRIEVLLPITTASTPPSDEPKVRRRLAPSAIWVVDDDPIFREMCHQVLSEEGHDLVEIKGGKQLHAIWNDKKAPPNVIIMDFSMPEYNGLELCEWLRDHGSRVPVILVSGFSAKQPDIKKVLKIRKTYFLQKPFTSRDLVDSVTVAMGETLIGDVVRPSS